MYKQQLAQKAERVGEQARADATNNALERASTRALYVEHGGQHAENGLDWLAQRAELAPDMRRPRGTLRAVATRRRIHHDVARRQHGCLGWVVKGTIADTDTVTGLVEQGGHHLAVVHGGRREQPFVEHAVRRDGDVQAQS